MIDCVLYARVSTPEQERDGFSLPAQIELLMDYAKRHGFKVVDQFVEAETAKSSGREEFNKMLEFIGHVKTPKVILVEKTDRFYRNWKDYVTAEDLMNNRGLEVHFVKENEILSRTSSSHAKFIHGIKVLMAKNYIDNLAEETRKGIIQKAKEGGWPHHIPFQRKKSSVDLDNSII